MNLSFRNHLLLAFLASGVFVPAARAPAAPIEVAAAAERQVAEDQEARTRDEPAVDQRIVTPEEVAATARPGGSKPFLLLGWPCTQIYKGMESGLVSVEKHKMLERYRDFQERLAARGFGFLFGGLGEGTGIGLGLTYDVPPRVKTAFRLTARQALISGYQDFSASLETVPIGRSDLILQANYQWRPFERFYGSGQNSLDSNRSMFALRQSSLGPLWSVRLHSSKRLRAGVQYTLAWLYAEGADGGSFPSTETVFGESLAGLGVSTRVQSIGAFISLNGFRGEYVLGGRADVGASWQEGLEEEKLRYDRYEGRLEGRLPVARGRSALVGQAVAELTREGSGSSALPFYLYPRLGGSATLRGFPLDRFYGRNIIFLTLEYRYAIHPNVEAQIIFDEGQVFQHTRDLSFWGWHRNYGFGIRFRSRESTPFRLELVHGSEGLVLHFAFGDRLLRPLGGPVRYPLYRP